MTSFFKKIRLLQPLFIGFCAMCMAAQTLFLLENGPVLSNQYPFFIGLLTVFGYHVMSKDRSKQVIGWLGGLAAAVVFLKSSWPMGHLPFLLLGVCASYYFPAVRRVFFGKNVPLRASTFGKPLTIGFVWVAVTVFPLYFFFEMEGRVLPLVLMSIGRFNFICALALAYDLIDEKVDRGAGLPTIPVRYGADFTKKTVIGLCGAGILAVAGLVAVGFYSPKMGAFISVSFVAAAFLGQNLPFGWRTEDTKMLVDSMMVLQFLLVLLAF